MAGLFVALAVIVGGGSAVLAWSQVRRTASLVKGDPSALARALLRVPAADRVGELLRRTEPGTWAHDLAEEVLGTPDDAGKVAAVNHALAEMERSLTEGADWPRSAVRISLLGALLVAFAAFLADSSQVRWSPVILAIGGVAALSCVEAGKSARRSEAKQRRAVDELVAAVFGEGLPMAEAPAQVRNARNVRNATTATRRRSRRRP